MNNFGMIYRYELKKITSKKFTVISLLMIHAMLIIFTCMNFLGYEYAGDKKYMSNAEAIDKEIRYDKALTGLAINDEMIKQTKEAYKEYKNFKNSFGKDISGQQEWDAKNLYWNTFKPYYSIYRFCLKAYNMASMDFLDFKSDKSDLYSAIENGVYESFASYGLTDKECNFWDDKYAMIQTPITFYYYKGYKTLISSVYFLCAVLMIYAAIALSGLFADEKSSRCDQLILSCRNGKKTVYFAKLAAGLTITEGGAVTVLAVYSLLTFAIFGTDGFAAPLQLYDPLYPYPVSAGTFLIIEYVILLIIIMLISMIVIFISINTDKSIIPLSIIIARVIIGMFVQMPVNPRLVSQIWTLLPVNYLYANNIYDLRLIPFFGQFLVSWQAVPWIYIAAGFILYFFGRILYAGCKG